MSRASLSPARRGRNRGALGALFDLLLELLDHLGHRLAHPAQLPVLDLDHPQGVLGDHAGRAGLLLQQRLLAEDVAGAELGELLAVALDARLALLDHVEVVGVAALLDHDLAGRELVDLRERGDLGQALVRHVREQGGSLQLADVHLLLRMSRGQREPNRKPGRRAAVPRAGPARGRYSQRPVEGQPPTAAVTQRRTEVPSARRSIENELPLAEPTVSS